MGCPVGRWSKTATGFGSDCWPWHALTALDDHVGLFECRPTKKHRLSWGLWSKTATGFGCDCWPWHALTALEDHVGLIECRPTKRHRLSWWSVVENCDRVWLRLLALACFVSPRGPRRTLRVPTYEEAQVVLVVGGRNCNRVWLRLLALACFDGPRGPRRTLRVPTYEPTQGCPVGRWSKTPTGFGCNCWPWQALTILKDHVGLFEGRPTKRSLARSDASSAGLRTGTGFA